MYAYQPVLDLIVSKVREAYSRQVTDPAHRAHGAFLSEVNLSGYPNADHTSNSSDLTRACQVYLAPGSPLEDDAELLKRIRDSIGFQRRWQRETGLIDLAQLNLHSPPDTGFSVNLCSAVLKIARKKAAAGNAGAKIIADELGEYVRTAANGMIGRGFHTPNHRWVVCSALAQAMELFPELPALDYVNSILIEGIDIQSDGEYTERSNGVYNAVVNRALIHMADGLNRPDLLEHARKSLEFMAHMFHDDGAIVTSYSNRQDHGLRIVPIGVIDGFYEMARRDGNGTFAAVADLVFDNRMPDVPFNYDWLLDPFLQHPELQTQPLPRKPMPNQLAKHFAVSGLWRVKRDRLSATVAVGNRTMMAVQFGKVNLKGIKISGTYLGSAKVMVDSMESIPGGVRLINTGKAGKVDGPHYDLPLNRPIPYGDFYKTFHERKQWPLPKMTQTIDITEVPGGFDIHLQTAGGIDRIVMEIEFSFEGPGEWETPESLVRAVDGGEVFLKSGYGIFRRGNEAISIGPGCFVEGDWNMRESEPRKNTFRVLSSFDTPFDRKIEIRCGAWSLATRKLIPAK